MENIILTNNKDLRLVSVKVGVLSTLRFELPLVSASATHVEVIVTSGDVHSSYTATFIDATKRWQCDIAASQFPAVGKQSYEVAYVLDGKQFWDGKGWIEIENATTSGIEPQPRPEPYRYVVVSVNGYGADAQGNVRIPKTFIATDSPTTTEGFIEGDIYFNRETGAMWTLCNVQGTLTWVFNYKNYYTKEETDQQIDRVAAYYITYNVQGDSFPTRAALVNAQTYYSGGAVRVPTRNDYANVLSDETHGGAQWRYIFAVPEGQTTGQWEPQYPIETNDYSQLSNKPSINNVTLTGNKTVADLGLASTADATLTPIYSQTPTFSEWTFSDVSDGITDIQQPVFIPPTEGEPRWEVSFGYDGRTLTTETFSTDENATNLAFEYADEGLDLHLTAIRTRTDILGYQLGSQTDKPLASEAEAEVLRDGKLDNNVQTAYGTASLSFVSEQDEPLLRIMGAAEEYIGIGTEGIRFYVPGQQLARMIFPLASGTLALLENIAPDFSTSDTYAVNALCVYNHAIYRCTTAITTAEAWTPAHWTEATVEDVLAALRTAIAGKADTSDLNTKLDSTSAAPAFSSDSSVSYAVDSRVTYNGKLYKCTTATTGGTWVAASWTADTMADPDAVLDITSQNQLRVVAKDGTLLWAQGYDLASTSSATLACDAANNFTFANGATTQAFTLPTAPTGKVGDFGLDIDNSTNASAATMTLTGLDSTFSVVVPEGESLNDMLAIAAGELARFYISLSTFRVNNLPTWHILKQVVENGGATV